MRYIIFLILAIANNSYADCVFGLDNINNLGGLKDVIRCLQDEVNSIKGQESDNQANVQNRYYAVQVFATSNRNYAEEVRETFKNLGYDSFIKFSLNTTTKNKPIWHKVMVGKYQWESEAQQEKSNIKLSHPLYKDCFVTSVVVESL